MARAKTTPTYRFYKRTGKAIAELGHGQCDLHLGVSLWARIARSTQDTEDALVFG